MSHNQNSLKGSYIWELCREVIQGLFRGDTRSSDDSSYGDEMF